MDFEDLKGKTLIDIKVCKSCDDYILFTDSEQKHYKLFHYQDCCEDVTIDDICGDLSDLLNSPILLAEEVSNNDPLKPEAETQFDSFTWTFYKLSTIKGSVTIRWFGTSNGYYSESVSFEEITQE